ncbi:SPOR domain-containing protein [Pseudogemmobacter sp. W21_MBD1_M6]|uniref:SPOR domain-containing protein n=1 Tax=Pseudogemmobacter sp. W21_MBD1_M6 TaxID=3240271 RepID=UPI003F9A64A8
MDKTSIGRLAIVAGVALLLAGCDENSRMGFLKSKTDASDSGVARSSSTKLVERDVESPDAFQVTEDGLWDGRPSLGGVWVAYPGVQDPERVIIRNQSNGKFVIGALFRRERENPGPKMQVSSDAANALGMLAGQPAKLNVTALRREEVPEVAPAATESPTLPAPEAIAEAKLDPIAGAAAAIARADAKAPATAALAPVKAPAGAPKSAAASASGLAKPYLQIGIFSVESNADATANLMRKSGMVPTVKKQESSGKTFWRVIVGPAANKSEADALKKSVTGQGFADAYFVTN